MKNYDVTYNAGRTCPMELRGRSGNPANVLHYLGIFGNLKGYFYFVTAIGLVNGAPNRKLLVTKEIYPVIAQQYDTTAASVERAMRTILNRVWEQSPEKIEHIAGCKLEAKPKLSAFIDILASFCRERSEFSLFRPISTDKG